MEDEIQIPVTLHPGIREHFIRAVLFNNLGAKAADPANRFRAMMAAVYSCQAMAELMLDRAGRGELTVERGALKDILAQCLPFFNLIERIRIHDFHRYGLIPPNPSMNMVAIRGPIELIARQGAAGLTYGPQGPERVCSGKSTIKEQRPLFDVNGMFFDEDSGTHVDVNTIIREYLKAIPNAVREFEKRLTTTALG